MYGGVKGFFFKRFLMDFCFRVWVRIAWLPFTIHFIGTCLGQREYDNNAYDYFYFSDWGAWWRVATRLLFKIYKHYEQF